MFPFLQSGEASGNETVTRLLVSGHANMEDLWILFSSYGEVSSFVVLDTGVKVTFRGNEALSRFHQSGEITFGERRLLVTKIQERKDQESLNTRFSLPPPPSLNQPNLEFLSPLPPFPPLPPLPPFSLHYDASMIRSPQTTPRTQHQPQIFNFDTSASLETEPAQFPCEQHFLQPLTPLSPGPPSLPPPKVCRKSFYIPPPSRAPTVAAACSVQTQGVSGHSSDTSGPHTVFSSPYKKFVKFEVTWKMIAEALTENIILL